MENKKIKNANPKEYDGIKFKSILEVSIYKTLVEKGIVVNYEGMTFEVSPKVIPTIPFYNRTPKQGFHQIKGSIKAITYTPDFTFTRNNLLVIIEAKGFENDVFPVKRNLFRKYLETLKIPCIYFEVRTKKELLEALKIIDNEKT